MKKNIALLNVAVMCVVLALAMGLAQAKITYVDDVGGWYKDDPIFSAPTNVLYYEGLLYVSDVDQASVYKINITDENVIKTIKTETDDDPQLGEPRGLFGLDGWVYIADMEGSRIFIYKKSPALYVYESLLRSPVDFYIDGDTLYVLSNGQSRIYVYENGHFNTSIGIEGAYDGMFQNPEGMDVHDDKIYVADTKNDRIEVIYKNGSISSYLGIGKGGVSLANPSDVFYYDGYVIVADTENGRIVVFDENGNPIEAYNCSDCLYPEDTNKEDEIPDEGNWTFEGPKGVFVSDGYIYVADEGSQRVVVLKFEPQTGSTEEMQDYIDGIKGKYENIFLPHLEAADGLNITYDTSYLNVYTNAQHFEEQEEYLTARNWYEQLDIKMGLILPDVKDEINKKLGFMRYDLQIDINRLPSSVDTESLNSRLNRCGIELNDKNYLEAYDCFTDLRKDVDELKYGGAGGEEGNVTEEEQPPVGNETTANETTTSLTRKMDEIEDRISIISQYSTECKYNLSIAGYSQKLSTARAYYEAGDEDNANEIVDKLDEDTSAMYDVLTTRCSIISYVLTTQTNLSTYLEAHYSEDPKYYEEAKKELNRVMDILYSDPASARSQIDTLSGSVYTGGKIGEVAPGAWSIGQYGLVGVIVIVVALAALVYYVLKRRKWRRKRHRL